jgi:rfaE bifunctional protein nucleotidyltransferase chain/domain
VLDCSIAKVQKITFFGRIIARCSNWLVMTAMISGVYTLKELERSIASDPDNWRPIVFTNGCFDILHAGHVRYLQAAKNLGRSLVVGLNSDVSVQAIKPQQPGLPPRPIVPENQRAEVLAALKPVDAVVIFSEITATKLINILKPDIYVKGGDYQVETLPEAPAVIAGGGKISLIQIEVPSSTSAIVKRILQLGT